MGSAHARSAWKVCLSMVALALLSSTPEPLAAEDREPPPLLVPALPPAQKNASEEPRTASPDVITGPDLATWQPILQSLAISLIPHDYENTKDWGRTKTTFSGIRADTRKGYPRFSKRETAVRHGLWKRYRVTLIDPAQTLKISLSDLGSTGESHRVMISAEVKAAVNARVELWTLGVKGLNGEVSGTGTMRIDVTCCYRFESLFQNGLPALRLVPEVERVNLTLVEYTADKVGLLQGDLAEAAGDGSRAILREIINGQEKKLLRKVQAQVAENQDRLTLAPGNWWFGKTESPRSKSPPENTKR